MIMIKIIIRFTHFPHFNKTFHIYLKIIISIIVIIEQLIFRMFAKETNMKQNNLINRTDINDTIPETVIDMQQYQEQYYNLIKQNLYLKNEVYNKTKIFQHKKDHKGRCINTKAIQTHTQNPMPKIDGQSIMDLPLWALQERGRYLEQKMKKANNQYNKQHKKINQILNSQKWKNRQKCNEKKCYHHKYLQLLRVKSPFY